MSGHRNFFINLHTLCVRYGKSPSDYLFPHVECPHFRLQVDTWVFNVGEPALVKAEMERAAKVGGATILGGL